MTTTPPRRGEREGGRDPWEGDARWETWTSFVPPTPGNPYPSPPSRTPEPPPTRQSRRGRRALVLLVALALLAVVVVVAALVLRPQAAPRAAAPPPAPSALPSTGGPVPPAPPAAAAPAVARDVVASTPLGGTVYAGGDLQRVTGCSTSSSGSTPTEKILPGRLLYAACSGQATVVDLASGRAQPIGTRGESAYPGTTHVFTTRSSQIPAGPLTPARTVYSLQAFDARSGTPSWTVDLEPWASRDGVSPTRVVEGPTGDPSHPRGVYVRGVGQSMLDADTGVELWHVGPEGPPMSDPDSSYSSAEYVDRGVSVTDSAPGGPGHTGYDPRTGRQVWAAVSRSTSSDGDASFLTDDGTQWDVGPDGWFAYDLRTGAVRAQGAFPDDAATRGIAVRPGQAALGGDSAVTLVDLTVSGPRTRWIAAGQAAPKAVSADLVVVTGPIGVAFLRTGDGSIAGTLPGASLPVQQVHDGLVVLEDGGVIKVGR